MTLRFALPILMAAVVAGSGAAVASTAYKQFGDRGRPQDVRRTIELVMGDNFFRPQTIQVRVGETVRFRVRNQGQLLHEFNLGTPEMHAEHRREMLAMFESGQMTAMGHGAHGGHGAMAHDDPNSILLNPGESGELIWKFTRAMTLEFACNIPGHYEAGMVGPIQFAR